MSVSSSRSREASRTVAWENATSNGGGVMPRGIKKLADTARVGSIAESYTARVEGSSEGYVDKLLALLPRSACGLQKVQRRYVADREQRQ